VQLIDALNDLSRCKFIAEIGGYRTGETDASFLRTLDFYVNNRIESSEMPVSDVEEYYTSAQTHALVQTPPDFQFSIDGITLWHTPQVAADRYYREQRNGGEWSEAIALIVPADGTDGDSAYQVWLNEGNTGTVDDYLASLQGIQGETGANGTGVAPLGTYAAGTTYALNEGVTYAGSYYRSLAADNTGNQPDTSPASWELMIASVTGPEVKHIIKDSDSFTGGTITLDAYKDIYKTAVAADVTFTFDVSGLGTLTDKVVTFELHIDMTTVATITFPASVSWLDEPLMNVIGVYYLAFRTDDGGTTWLGNLAYEVV
jgi:hypothetical protein